MSSTTSRAAVLLIGDERSRSVCSLLLRHQGYRVYEALGPDDVPSLAREHDATLVVADLDGDERQALHRELQSVPGLRCMFVRLRHDLREVDATFIRPEPANSFAVASSRN